MAELPTGTVTFLFTDIEGSTKLLRELGDRYADALAEHRAVLRAAFERHEGVEVDTQGDAFFVAFQRASDAIAAAQAAQRELELPVRMGIHTGEPAVTAEGYVGIDVHRAARICSAAHGGQVVVSQTTRDLAEIPLRDLGEHRLKDLGQPVRLYQPSEEEFPPLRSLNQTNLPAQPSPLVGRERELSELQPLVRESRLVTLTGPGGSGKTRLALQTAAELVESFDGGVFWVPLAAISDPELVEPTIAQTIGAQDGLIEYVGDGEMLLLLDNLEQLLEVAPELAELLERCPNLHLLVTSRAPLRIAGEQEYSTEPLPEDDAVTLFRERAAVAEPVEAVAEICRRLDRLPLAIELAAARTRLLPPDKLLERLEQRLPLLTGGRRDAPERQRTLHATIEWSYDLLSERERVLFARLGVFAGSFTLEAAEEVCDADLETLDSLLEQSLVRRWESGRLGMLETIREYAVELLDRSGEAAEIRRRHAEFFLALAESANLSSEALERGAQRMDLVLPEQANLRAAIDGALAAGETEIAGRLTNALELFWASQNPFEGMRRMQEVLDTSPMPLRLRARLVRGFGSSADPAGEIESAERAYEQSLALFRDLGDEEAIAHMLMRLGASALKRDDLEAGRALLEESLARNRSLGNRITEAQVVSLLGTLAWMEGESELALERLEQCVAIVRERGFTWWEAVTTGTLAEYTLDLGRARDSERWARETLRLGHGISDRQLCVFSLAQLSATAAAQGSLERAGRLWGAVEAEEARGPVGAWERERAHLEERILACGNGELERGRTGGRSLSLDDAVEYALSDID